MPRIKKGVQSRLRRKRVLKMAKGYRGSQHRRFRSANEAVMKAGRHAFADRRKKKREFRGLWIQRINAAARLHGLPYSQFIHGLQMAGVTVDRKMLADIAMNEPDAFSRLADVAKSSLG